MKRIILASTSLQRIMLLKQAKIKFEVIKSYYQEDLTVYKNPHKLTQYLSSEKAKVVAAKLKNAIVIAADTIVCFNNELIGKPKDICDAKRILNLFNGKTHEIITGFTIIDVEKNTIISKSVLSKVTFKKLTEKQIDDYIKTDEPMNKAGAYGIQGLGKKLIKKVEGDFDNVVGLPLFEVIKELNKLLL